MAPPFHITCSYESPETGIYWWDRFNLDAVRRDFEVAAHFELRYLSVALRWDAFQPEPDRVSVPMLRSLERVLDAAADRSLTVLPVLFPVLVAGMPFLPSWVLGLGPSTVRPVLTGEGISHRPISNLFADGRVIEGQRRLLREVTGAFGDHPAVAGWVVGDRLGEITPPPSSDAFAVWLRAVVQEISGPSLPIWHGVGARQLVESNRIEPRAVTEAGVRLRVTAGWSPGWARAERWWSPFLAGYSARLSGLPAVVDEIHPCTTTPALRVEGCVAETEAAQVVAEVVPRIQEMGGAGVGIQFCDLSPDLERILPYRSNAGVLTRGIFHPDLSPKPGALLCSEFSLERRPVVSVPDVVPEVDPELRMRDPEGVAREVYEVFVR